MNREINSPFQACCCNSLHQILLEEDEYYENRKNRQRGHGEERAYRCFFCIQEHSQRQIYRKLVQAAQIDHLTVKVIPCPHEGEDDGSDHRRYHQRYDDTSKQRESITTVKGCRLVQFFRYPPDKLNHQKDKEGICCKEFRHHYGKQCVQPVQSVEDDIPGDNQNMNRDHHGEEHAGKQNFLEFKVKTGKSKGSQSTGYGIAKDR